MEEQVKHRVTLTIHQRLLMLIVCFICFPVLVIGWSWYRSSTETIEQSAIEANQRIIEQTNDYLDLYVTNLANSTYPFLNNALIQTLLASPSLTPYAYFQLSEKVEDDLFAQMVYGRSDIVGISLITSSGRQMHDFSEADQLLDMKEIRIRNAGYMTRIGEMDDFQVLGTGKVGTTPVFTVVRKLYSNTTYRYEGLLIVDLNLRQIEHISRNVSLGSFNVWIADSNGSVIYDSDPALTDTSLPQEFMDRIQGERRNTSFRLRQSGEEKIVLYAFSGSTDWIIVADISLHDLIGNMIRMRNLSLVAAAILLLVAIAAVAGFSFSFTRPLTKLRRLMAKVEAGDFTVPKPGRRLKHDEIGSVFRSFYRMVGELNRLVLEVHSARLKERELAIKHKESALQAMQARINPHFLYNSLEIINSEAIVSDNREISRMTTALAHLFRYNLGNSRQHVPLQEELAHIRSYLSIQQARFPKLQVDVAIGEADAARVQALRLTLQPIVENVFMHGYKNKKPLYIGIEGTAEDDAYCVTVADRGVGMTPDRLASLRRLLETADADAGDSGAIYETAAGGDLRKRVHAEAGFREEDALEEDARDGERSSAGIGLLNVHQRLRLYYGAPFGVSIRSSSPGEGTAFVVRLPYETGLTLREVEKTDVSDDDRRG
ncbi:sensor histidine kinase [Cohnella rhizosphaerae]|uniref:histidine kinase n=1 Tax=Cohnella rhizosphaerae TaxID=1457232 RepID=A0A9X4KZ93_9BACL|nr:sensor histidine kinase [Cohnella rhizosphaerae]MDG0814054.1 histidine kinase [Cohnella rhizosphaerae]